MHSKYGPRDTNPLLARLDHKAKQSKAYHASPKLERKLAKTVGGHRTSGSGNKREKGDVRKRGVMRIEHKATQHDSFRVTKTMLQKIELAATGCDEVPMLTIEFLDKRGDSEGAIACLRLEDALRLLNNETTD